MIAPVYEQLARDKGVRVGTNGVGAVFTKIDMSTPSGNQLASQLGVRVMPTFMFFLDGIKASLGALAFSRSVDYRIGVRNEGCRSE